MTIKKTLLGILLLCMGMGALADTGELVTTKRNPRFDEYVAARKAAKAHGGKKTNGGSADGSFVSGYVPHIADYSYLVENRARARKAANRTYGGDIPSSWDSRTKGWITSVKDQNPYGTCWAHATMACLETWVKKTENKTVDFSEKNLINLHGFYVDPLNGNENDGGNGFYSAGYLTRWEGPVLESQDPYPTTDKNWSTSSKYSPARHVQNVAIIAPRTSALDNNSIKQAIMDYGAIHLDYWHDGAYLNGSTGAYYCPGAMWANHSVAVVGWDDNYSKSNFKNAPPGNGAFLVKNSWGTSFGKDGYVWVSYYDDVLGYGEGFAYPCEKADNYDIIQQYDPYGHCMGTGLTGGGTLYGANMFVSPSAAKISAVGVYIMDYSIKYEVSIYTGCTAGNPISGTLRTKKQGVTGTDYCGYFTVELDSEVSVPAGTRYSVVVKFIDTPDGTYPFGYEEYDEYYTPNATSNAGESFFSSTGTTWHDLVEKYPGRNANFCCKAYLKNGTGPSNDNFENAIAITGLSGEVSGSTLEATAQDGEPLVKFKLAADHTIWWKWTPTSSGTATVDTKHTAPLDPNYPIDFDTVLGIYKGSSLASLTTVAENDDIDTGATIYTSECEFNVTAGTTYYIAVSGYNFDQGTITVTWKLTPITYTVTYKPGANGIGAQQTDTKINGVPLTLKGAIFTREGYLQDGWATSDGGSKAYALSGTYSSNGAMTFYPTWRDARPENDDFAKAKVISGMSGLVTESTEYASYETGEPLMKFNSDANHTIWYKWTAPTRGSVTFSTEGSGLNTVMGIYYGTSFANLTVVAENDNADDINFVYTSLCKFTAISGRTYYIAVSGDSPEQGEIKLKWNQTPTTYKITYKPGANGTGSQQTDTKTYNVDLTLKGAIFTRAGYIQVGWSTTDGGAKIYDLSETYSGNSAITLYPVWSSSKPANDDFDKAITISGASGSVSGSTTGATIENYEPLVDYLGSENIKSTIWWKWTAPAAGEVTFDTKGSAIDTVMGIYTGATKLSSLIKVAVNDDGFNDVGPSLCKFTATSGQTYYIAVCGFGNLSGAVKLNWSSAELKTYKVTYKPGANGKGSQQTDTKVQDVELTLKGAIFTRTGYTQTGWSKTDGGSKNYSLSAKYKPNVAITLYPVWTANTYTISLYRNTSSSDTTKAGRTYTYDVSKALPKISTELKWSKSGYSFVGWATSASATTAKYTDGQSVKNLSSKQGATVKLYAVWKQNASGDTYILRLHRNNSARDGATAGRTYTIGKARALPKIQSELKWAPRTGYDFLGWAKTANATTAQYYDGQSLKDLSTTKGAEVHLYAVWKAHKYIVRLHRNNSKNDGATTGRAFDYDQVRFLPTMAELKWVRNGYMFLGWSQAQSSSTVKYADGLNVYNLSAKDGEELHIWGVWKVAEANAYLLRLHRNNSERDGATAGRQLKLNTTRKLPTIKELGWTRTDATFKGWATTAKNAAAGKVTYRDGANVSNLVKTQGDTAHIYAVWQ